MQKVLLARISRVRVSLIVILGAAVLFTNAVEILGGRLKLGPAGFEGLYDRVPRGVGVRGRLAGGIISVGESVEQGGD